MTTATETRSGNWAVTGRNPDGKSAVIETLFTHAEAMAWAREYASGIMLSPGEDYAEQDGPPFAIVWRVADHETFRLVVDAA